MSNVLYIIGNGFDIHHRLSTKYCHYFLYLWKKFPDILSEMNASKFFSGLEIVDIDDFSPKNYNKLWSDLEISLEYAFEDHFEDTLDYAPDFMDEHPDFGAIMYQVKNGMSPFFKFTRDMLIEWVKYAEMGKCIKDERLNLSSNATYLTFNYTNTLQTIYDIPDANILHIHGSLKEFLANGKALQFGNPKESAEKLQRRLENKYADNPWGCWVTDAIPSIVELCKTLTKNLKQNYESLKNFIQNKEFDEVIVMGHSFMGVDKPYYDDILVPCLEKCKWIFYVHNDDDKKNVLKFKQEHTLIRIEEIVW